MQDYLEIKRCSFPRFYFISNNELLDILAHTKQPSAVQVSTTFIMNNHNTVNRQILTSM